MENKVLYFGIIIAILLTPMILANAFELPDDFDEPCPMGMSIIQEVCVAVNQLHTFLHIQETRINSLNVTQIVQQTEINDLKGNVTSLDARIISNDNDITSLQSQDALHTVRLDFLNSTQIAEQLEQDIISATQISEQIEQDAIETNLNSINSTLQAHLALPITTSKIILADNNLPSCENALQPAPGWCPRPNLNFFNITDSNVNETSFVGVHVDGSPSSVCTVTDIEAGSFLVVCVPLAPLNGSELYYIIVD